MQTLDVGEVAQIATQWWDSDGDAAEPTAITLTITKPDGTIVTVLKAAMTGSESGSVAGTQDVWTALQTADQAGVWRYTPVGTVDTALVTQEERVFLVGVDAPSGPCEPWCTWDEVTACVTDGLLDGLNSAAREVTIDIASEIVFNLDGRYYPGICQKTKSLCIECLTCRRHHCGCAPRDTIDLGGRYPVYAAWDVVVDGETLAPAAYTVYKRRHLALLEGTWPRGTDILDPAAFRATWAFGRPVPPGGRRAAALFAAEIAKGCLQMDCQIPQRVSSITREGVSYPVLDSLSMIAEGRTGVALTDLWVVADLQSRKPRPGFFSPGAREVHRA